MTQQAPPINKQDQLEAKRRAVLEKLMKGKLAGKLKTETIPKRETQSPVRLSFSQERLWILDQMVPGNPFYNLPTALRLGGDIDIEVFKRTLNEVARRHETLRTVFTVDLETEEPVQVILPETEINVDIIDLRELPPQQQELQTAQLMAAEAAAPFDLEKGPLLRVKLVQINEDTNVLLHTMHHIISDTWSMEIFNKEILTLYSAFSQDKPSPLPEPALQYADYAVWQRGWLQGDVLEKQLSYWREVLSGDLPILELPTDRQRPAVSSYRGRIRSLQIPGNLVQKLTEINRQEKCTMFMTLSAVFNVLMYRYSGQDDILVGSPIANRNRTEVEEIIGFFSNTVVLRTDLSGNPTFRELMARVRAVNSGAYDNQDLPFEKLVEELQPERYMSHTPFFQVMFVLQNIPKAEIDEEAADKGTGISELPVHSGSAKFDLWLSMWQAGNTVDGVIEYNIDVFNDDTIGRFVHNYLTLVTAISLDPDLCIDDIPIIAEEEKKQLLHQWNDTAAEYQYQCLHHAFENQVERTPGATAVIFDYLEVSYERLNRKINRLARTLMEKGVTMEMPVGVCMERSVELVVSLFAIMKAGGAYLPLDPEYPDERISFMMDDANISFLLTQEDTYKTMPPYNGEVIMVDSESELVSFSEFASTDSNPDLDIQLHNLAYIIFTSGSTGKPKGAAVHHRGISNRLIWMQNEYGLTPEDRVLQKTPFSFDVSVWEFFWPLTNGAVLVMAEPGGHKDPLYLVEVINNKKITTIHFVPSMLNAFLEAPGLDGIESLKRVIASGEALPFEYVERFYRRIHCGAKLHNLYGPTEASVDVTYWECPEHNEDKVIPIGRPVANTQIYILDKQRKPVPVGVHGELHIGGIQVARGFLNRPDMTAGYFIPDPFSNQPGARLYKTGDLCKWRSDGTIEFIGRLDFQVKVRGFRIELGEIEANLRNHKDVKDAAVMARQDAPGSDEKKLAAYIVPDQKSLAEYSRGGSGDLVGEQVTDWEAVFDDTYGKDHGQEDQTFNIIGWNSSFNGEPLPADQMKLWVDNTVERILDLKPDRIMEIGCGTGLYLFRIIPYCSRFIGTDIAKVGLDYIQHQLDVMENQPGPQTAEVQLMQRSADQFDDIEPRSLDTIVCNSVVQYFPSVDYLVSVLEKAVETIGDGGHIFLGDIRSLPLLKTFHTAVEAHLVEPDTKRDYLYRRILKRLAAEQELALHPLFFSVLQEKISRISHVEILPKYGRYANELSMYRWDVILHIGRPVSPVSDATVWDWRKEGLTIDQLRARLEKQRPSLVVVTGIPNGRISDDIRLEKWLNSDDERVSLDRFREECTLKQTGTGTAPQPDDLLEAGGSAYRVRVRLSPGQSKDLCEAVFILQDSDYREMESVQVPHPGDLGPEKKPLHHFANNPLLAKYSGRIVPELRGYLRALLPEYMVPSNFVLLESFPVTDNGKLDRRALPEPVPMELAGEGEVIPPSTQLERFFADIWSQVLNVDQVGVNQNFFELGGDSINAIQVISRANKEGMQLPVQLLYQNQNIADLARAAEKERSGVVVEQAMSDFTSQLDMKDLAKKIPSGLEIEEVLPPTPMQIHQMHTLETETQTDPPIFLFQRTSPPMPMQLDINLLKTALQTAMDTYPLMRTLLIKSNLGIPVQVRVKEAEFDFKYYDYSNMSQERQRKKYIALMQKDWARGYKRDKNWPMRVVMVKLGTDNYVYFFIGDYTRIDGWSANSIIQEIFSCLGSLYRGDGAFMAGNPTDCYVEFLYTLRGQDKDAAKKYWLSLYKDFQRPKPLTAAPGNENVKGKGLGKEYIYLSQETSTRLEHLLLEKHLSLSVFIQGLWAMIISRYTGTETAVYGMLTTGRSIAIAGIENMNGHSINVLPIHIPISGEETMLRFLQRVWNIQSEWSRYEYTQIEEVYEWCEQPRDPRLFESIIVIQNLDSATGSIRGREKDSTGWMQTSHLFFAKMEYPLRFDVFTGIEYCMIIDYYRRFFAPPVMKGMLENMYRMVEAFVEKPEQPVQRLMDLIDVDIYTKCLKESDDANTFTMA